MKVGDKIGKFEIVAELGRGAMGTIYRARDPKLDRQVALKTVAHGLLERGDTLARFEREARAAAKLVHPNIVTIYELGEEKGTHYIAMELLEGTDLAALLAAPERVPLQEKVRIVIDICRGLDFAHKQGVLHRDVKPANIRIGPDGTVKIVDFGIARLTADTTMTQTGLVMGTPSYIAPEVFEGKRPDHRADMWAVGVILYEMISGRRPYEAPTIQSLMYSIVHRPPTPLHARELGVPEALVQVVTKALAKDPAERYPDLSAMAQALAEAMGMAGLETPLPQAARARAYELNFAEARRFLADGDLDAALEAARRAQALEPNRDSIIAFIGALEQQLQSAATVRRPPAREGAREATTASAPGASPISATTPRPLPTPVLTELRLRGASVFREMGIFGKSPPTQSVCLSPVKDVLAAAGSDGAIRLWDLHSRTQWKTLRSELHQRTGHDASALGLAFSPDGSVLASGHVDGNVHLWDVNEGTEVPVRLRHEALVGALAFSPDGSTLATGSMDTNLRLWDVGSALGGEARRQIYRLRHGVTAVAYVGGGDWILTGHVNRILRLLDARTGKLVATLLGPEALVSLLCPAPDGRHVAVASHDRMIRLYDLESRDPAGNLAPTQLGVLSGHKKPATSLSYFADGNHLATVAQDNIVQLWDLETRSPLAALWGQAEESFTGVALFGAEDHIAVALSDGRIRIWGPAH